MARSSLKGTLRPTAAQKLLGPLPPEDVEIPEPRSGTPRTSAAAFQHLVDEPYYRGVSPNPAPNIFQSTQYADSGYPVPTWPAMAVAGQWPYNPISTGDMTLADYLAAIGGGGGDGGGDSDGGSHFGGGVAAPGPITWSDEYTVDGAPSWWRGYVPSEWTPETEYVALLNSMIPFMSPEDQRTAASTLARMNIDVYTGYNPESISFAVPTEISTPLRRDYQSASRASSMLATLTNMAAAAGRTPEQLGPGYNFLRQIADVMKDFGNVGGEEQTRTQQVQMLGALDPLLAESKGENLGAYGGIGRMMSSPFFSAGQILPVARQQDGTYVFGRPNPAFYGV